jgi:hypothetical protein
MERNLRFVAPTLVVVLTWTACVENLEPRVEFENQTDEPVWVGHNAAAPEGFRIPERLWKTALPGERILLTDGGCVETGEFVVATEPSESAVIDRKPLASAGVKLCDGDHWEWSGIGDHD